MPVFKCSHDVEDGEHDIALKKLKGINQTNPKSKISKKNRLATSSEEKKTQLSPIGIPLEVIFDNIVKYLDISIAHKKLRLISKQWNNIILGNDEDYSIFFKMFIDFQRQQYFSSKFYSTAERGLFKNVTKLTMKALPQGLKKIENHALIPGQTIVTRGYRENIGGSVLKFFPNLQILDLNENEIPEEKFNWLLDLKSNQLQKLNLEDNRFGVKTCGFISSCANLLNLQELNLRNNKITDEGCKLICNSIYLHSITILDVSSTDLSVNGLLYISNSSLSNLTILKANNNNLQDNSLHQRIISGEFKFKNLKTLFIRNCGISPESQLDIAKDKQLICTLLDRILL